MSPRRFCNFGSMEAIDNKNFSHILCFYYMNTLWKQFYSSVLEHIIPKINVNMLKTKNGDVLRRLIADGYIMHRCSFHLVTCTGTQFSRPSQYPSRFSWSSVQSQMTKTISEYQPSTRRLSDAGSLW